MESDPGDAAGESPHAILGLPLAWTVTDAQVRAAQVRALARCHPDRHPEGAAREAAMRMSARINEAVAALATPDARAEAFVRAGGVAAIPQLPPEELMEWLERREWIEERRQEGGAGLDAIAQWQRATLNEILESIRSAICDAEGLPRRDADWDAGRLGIARLRALRRACGG